MFFNTLVILFKLLAVVIALLELSFGTLARLDCAVLIFDKLDVAIVMF